MQSSSVSTADALSVLQMGSVVPEAQIRQVMQGWVTVVGWVCC